ncbi:hypothetical protein CASFOL_007046 [Castilleja foliolosa]|uniref:Uncharacterized protein n=1 Tax=Castilleja foliolosa TaxID=1961234 RepID=A0ABD3E8H6_9LAMI
MRNSSSGGSGYLIHNQPLYNNSPNSDHDYDGILNSEGNNCLSDSPVLKHDTGLAVEWSVDEQHKLEQGLAKYANEPNIMRYIKIAALLHDKTVRDVALRCRWMNRRRRKPEDHSLGRKLKDRKDKLVDSTMNNTMPSASALQVPTYSLSTNHQRPSDYMLSGVLSCSARHLLEENNQAFNQISANLSTLKLQENIDLLSHTRNNITTIMNDMRNMPGIMSRMPPLPVLLNEDLATSIFPHSSQPMMMFGSSSSIPLKQEPERCVKMAGFPADVIVSKAEIAMMPAF